MGKILEVIGKFENSSFVKGFGKLFTLTTEAQRKYKEFEKAGTDSLKKIGDEFVTLSEKQKVALKELESAKNKASKHPTNDIIKDKEVLGLLEKQINEINRLTTAKGKQFYEEEKLHKLQLKMARESLGTGSGVSGGGVSLAGGTLRSIGRTFIPLGASYFAMRTAQKSVMDNIGLDREMIQVNNAVASKDPATKAFLENQVISMSINSGKDATEVARQYAQMLSTTQFSPGTEGSVGFMDKLARTGAVADRLNVSAKATGSDSRDYMDAATYTAQAYGVDMTDSKKAEGIMDVLAYTQRKGKGTMSEYAKEFQKFMPSAKASGYTMNEAAMLFANLTNHYDPARAGDSMVHFEKLFQQSSQTQAYVNGRMKTLGKQGLVPGTSEDQKILKGLTGQGISNMYYDANGKAKGLLATTKSISEVYSSLQSDKAKAFFLTMMTKNDSLSLKAMQMLTGDAGLTDENGNPMKGVNVLGETIKDANNGGVGGSNQTNVDNLNASVSQHFDVMQQTWKNGMIGFVNNAEPALNGVIETLTLIGSKLPAVGNFIRNMIGDIPEDKKTATNVAREQNEKTGDISGNIPGRHFFLTTPSSFGLRNDLTDLASEGGGEGKNIKTILSGKSVDTWDKIMGGDELPKKDFIDFFGKNASKAAQAISSRTADSGISQGVLGYFNEMPMRALYGDNATTNPSEMADAMRSFGISIEKNESNALESIKVQTTMAKYLGIIAGKSDIINFTPSLINFSGTSTAGTGKSSILNTLTKHL